MSTPAGRILRHAAEIVDGARNTQHGDKERSFACIAHFWSTYLEHRGLGTLAVGAITPGDVAAMMILMKLARALYGEPLADHFIDIAGYAGILGELEIDPEMLRSLFLPTEAEADEPEVVTFSGNPADLFNGA